MNKKIKGLLIFVMSVICSFCVFACDPTQGATSESVSESETHVCQFENWQTVKEASCEEEGEEKGYCACGETSTRPISALGHDYKDGDVIRQSTCSEHGLKKIICQNCEHEAEEELPLANHSFEEKEIAPTCSAEGRRYEKCSVCGEETQGEPIEKTAHDFVEEEFSFAVRSLQNCQSGATYWKTCSECYAVSDTEYFSVGEPSSHRLKYSYSCSVNECYDCEDTFEPTSDHNFGEWIEVGAGGCSATVVKFHACQDCGYIEDELGLNNAVSHHDVEFTEIPATCEEKGAFIVSCKNCDFESVVYYNALGHVYKWEVDKDGHKQVCLRDGCNKVNNQGKHRSNVENSCENDEVCVVCNYLMNARTGHKWHALEDKSPTCFEDGHVNAKECEYCHEIVKTVIEGGHDFEYNAEIKPTCTEEGVKEHNYCSKCLQNYDLAGNVLDSLVIEKLGHDGEWRVDEDATCTEDGLKGKYCTRDNCGERYDEEVIPALGHKDNWSVEQDATCEEEGLKVNCCSREGCGERLGEETIPAKGHNEEWRVEKEPTCTEDGLRVKYCSRKECGKNLDEEIISAEGHDDGKWHEEIRPTCTQKGTDILRCGKCGEVLETRSVDELGHDFEGEYIFDEHYHYLECQNGCGDKSGLGVHEYTQILHEETKDTGDQIVYTAYIEFACECGYSFNSETATSTVHQSIVAINPIAPTCTEVGYTAGLKCGVEGCGEIYLEPTEIPALGHDFINGLCLRCGEKQECPEEPKQITVFIEMYFANGEIWEDYGSLDSGHTIYSYFKTWDMWDWEIADIYYLEIDGIERPIDDIYNHVLVNGERLLVKFKTVTAGGEDTNDKTFYVVRISNKDVENVVDIVYILNDILTVKEFYEAIGIDANKVKGLFVDNALISDENYSLGHRTQMEIYYNGNFMPKNFAIGEVINMDENGNEEERREILFSLDLGAVSINDVALIFGYAYGRDFLEREEVVLNGEKVAPDYVLLTGDKLLVISKRQPSEPPVEEDNIEIFYECTFADDKMQTGSIMIRRGLDVYSFVDSLCEGASWSAMLFMDIESANFNGVGIDPFSFAFEQSGTITVKFATIASTIETIKVEIQLTFANGQGEKNAVEFISGASFKDFIKWFCSYDSWQEIFDDVDTLIVDACVYDKNNFIFEKSCAVEIAFKTYVPTTPSTIRVAYYVYDLNGTMQSAGEIEAEQMYLVDFVNNYIGLSAVALENVKSVLVNGEEIYDYQNYELSFNCKLEIYLDINQGGTDKNGVTIIEIDANGNQTGIIYSFEIEGENIILRDLVERNTPYTYEEFLMTADGVFYYNGEELNAESLIFARTQIEFKLNFAKEAKIEIYFSSDFTNSNFIIPYGTTIGAFFESYLPHPFPYCSFYDFLKNGEIYVNGKPVYDPELILEGCSDVRYDHRNEQCADGHVWNSEGYCSNCGTPCQHENMTDGNPCPECGYRPYYYFEYEVILYYGEYAEGDEKPFSGWDSTWTKVETYDLSELTLERILESDGTDYIRERIENAYNYGYSFVWTVNGREIAQGEIISEMATIVGILSTAEIKPFYVIVEDGNTTHSFEYQYPIKADIVFNKFLKYYDLSSEYYYYQIENSNLNIYGDIILGDTKILCLERREWIQYRIVDENGNGEWISVDFSVINRPTVGELMEIIGLSKNEYAPFCYANRIDVDEVVQQSLVFLKKSLISENIEITVRVQEDKSAEFDTYSKTISEPTSLERILQDGFYDQDKGGYTNISYNLEMSVVKIHYYSGISYIIGETGDPYADATNYVIYAGCIIEIVPAISYEISGENISAGKWRILSDKALTGEEIIEKAEIEDDLNMLVIFVNETRYGIQEFLTSTFSAEQYDKINVRFIKGRVNVQINVTDENGNFYGSQNDFTEVTPIENMSVPFPFEDYTWTIEKPNGEIIVLEEFSYVFKFDSENYQEWGYQNYVSNYILTVTANKFRVSFFIDGVYKGEAFMQNGEYTFSQILSQFGNYNVDDYRWDIRTVNGEWLDFTGTINTSVEIQGFESRPNVNLVVNGEQYRIYHTEEMTLEDLIARVGETYGVYVNYNDYGWDVALTDIVAWEGETNYVYARMLTEVVVNFYSEYGVVEMEYNAEGFSLYSYQRDSAWIYPNVNVEETTYGFMYFTGTWEYRYDGGQTKVESVYDLFLICRTTVELWAICDVYHERLMGTYVVADERKVIVVGEGNTICIKEGYGENNFSTYRVIPNALGFALEIGDGGQIIDSIFFQDNYKLNQDMIVIFALNPFGDDVFYSIEDFNVRADEFTYDAIFNVYGETVDEMTYGNVYYVRFYEGSSPNDDN